MHHGYEPARLAHLIHRSRAALGDLDNITNDDPAASDAMRAKARLRSVIADGLLPAATAVHASDPLGRRDQTSLATQPDWYRDWLRALVTTRYSTMTDDELFHELERLEYDLPYDDDFGPDLSDDRWIDFESLARELAVRAETDSTFTDRLARQAADTFLIPLAVRFAHFAPTLVADMLLTVSEWPSWSNDLDSMYRTYGAGILVDVLADYPTVALDTLASPDASRNDDIHLLEDLLQWPALDPDARNRFLDAAMSAPFDRPDLLPKAGAVLQQLIAIANGRSFPAEASPALAKITVQYLPFFVTSLNRHGDVHLKDFDFADIGIELGSYGDALDLFGALMRDATSLDVLLGSIPALTALARANADTLAVDERDLANYVRALGDSAKNERLEAVLAAARDRATADVAIDLVFGAVDLITSVGGPGKIVGLGAAIDLVEDGARRFVEWAITANDVGLDAVPSIAYLLTVYGVGVAVVRGGHGDKRDDERLDSRCDDNDPDHHRQRADDLERAREIVDTVERALDDGRPLDEIEGVIGDLQRIVITLDDDAATLLNDPRVVPPDYDVTARVDTEG